MTKMEHRSGPCFRDSAYLKYALRISIEDRAPRWIADRGTAEAAAQQKQHHSSSGGSDVAATDEEDERGCTGEPFVFVLALSRNLKRTSADTPRSQPLLFYCAVEYAKVTYTLDSSISLQASFFWRFVKHLGLPCESFTVQAVREFFPSPSL